MRYLSKFFVSCVSMIFALMSCTGSDEIRSSYETGVGNVNLILGFSKEHKVRSIPVSTSKPITSWSNNIKHVMALFVNNSGVVKAARFLPVPNENSTNSMQFVLQSIPAGDYDVYMIANCNESNIERLHISGLWNEGNVVGKTIQELSLGLVTNDAYLPNATTEVGMIGYKQPAELFVDRKKVQVLADQTSYVPPFQLARSVSILRVRIDQSVNGNEVVNFMSSSADLRVRKVATEFNVKQGFANVSNRNVLYVSGGDVFKDADPLKGYTGGKILDPINNITLWSDVLMFPGGSKTEGAKKFDIVIGGMAPEGYIPLGAKDPLQTSQMVYWSGQIQADVIGNNILEVNCILKQAGSTEVPEIGAYGNLDMTINIEDWGNIASTDMEM